MTKEIKSVSVIGDSIFKGVVYDKNRKRYVVSHESSAYLLKKEVPFEINNYSKFGITIKDAYEVLKYVLENSDDEIIVIEIGGNDSDFDWDSIAAYPDFEHLSKVPKDEYEMYLIKMVKMCKKAKRNVILTTLPNISSEKYLNWVSKTEQNKTSILKWLGPVERINSFHDEYNVVIRKIAKKYHLSLIELNNRFSLENIDELTDVDGIHPSLKGYKLIKDIILETLKQSPKYTF